MATLVQSKRRPVVQRGGVYESTTAWEKMCEKVETLSTFAAMVPDVNVITLSARLDKFRGKIIVIEGSIAVGKSTTCLALKRLFDLAGIPCSLFKEDPGLKGLDYFLGEKQKRAFPFQTLMVGNRLLSYQRATFRALQNGEVVIMDRSLDGDRAFENMHREEGNISEQEHEVYMEHVMANAQYFIKPYAVVYLYSSVEKARERIERRGNVGEIEAYTPKYLTDLNRNYERCLGDPLVMSADDVEEGKRPANTRYLSVEEDDEDLVLFAESDTVSVPYIEARWAVENRTRQCGQHHQVLEEEPFKKTIEKLFVLLEA
jgi:deoxyadenosine/deoxycytidine kinase